MNTYLWLMVWLLVSALSFLLGWYFGVRSARKLLFRRNLKVYANGLFKRDVQ